MVSFFIAALALAWASACFQGFWALVGGTVMVPLFRLAFGMEPIAATATSLFTIVPTSISGHVEAYAKTRRPCRGWELCAA